MLANKLDSQVKERAQKMTRAATIGLGLSAVCEDILCVGVHVCVCVCRVASVCVCVSMFVCACEPNLWPATVTFEPTSFVSFAAKLATLTEAPQSPPLPRPLPVADDILKSRVALTFWHCL